MNKKPPMCLDPLEEKSFRCCSDNDASTNPNPSGKWLYNPTCGLWSASEILGRGSSFCAPKLSYHDAAEYCASIHARLCTVEEFNNDCTAGAGCGASKLYLWTSSTMSGENVDPSVLLDPE